MEDFPDFYIPPTRHPSKKGKNRITSPSPPDRPPHRIPSPQPRTPPRCRTRQRWGERGGRAGRDTPASCRRNSSHLCPVRVPPSRRRQLCLSPHGWRWNTRLAAMAASGFPLIPSSSRHFAGLSCGFEGV